MTEKEIENSILEFLKIKGIYAWKCQTTGIYDPKKKVFRKSNNKYHIKGIADILGVFDGKMLAIEVKKPKCYPSPDQKKFLEMVNNRGGIAFVARSIDDVIVKLSL